MWCFGGCGDEGFGGGLGGGVGRSDRRVERQRASPTRPAARRTRRAAVSCKGGETECVRGRRRGRAPRSRSPSAAAAMPVKGDRVTDARLGSRSTPQAPAPHPRRRAQHPQLTAATLERPTPLSASRHGRTRSPPVEPASRSCFRACSVLECGRGVVLLLLGARVPVPHLRRAGLSCGQPSRDKCGAGRWLLRWRGSRPPNLAARGGQAHAA